MTESSPSPSARKRLPVKPSLEHLKKQAKRRAKSNPKLNLAKAQHEIAKDYGCADWKELTHMVETMLRGADQLSNVKYVFEALPQAAKDGDLERARAILKSGEYTPHDLDLALGRSTLKFDERGEMARLLLDHGADPDGQYGSGYGPIVFGTGECLDPQGLKFLLDAGADVNFPPIETKYGTMGVMDHWLGTYVRGRNEQKHQGIKLLLEAGAPIPEHVAPEMLAIHLGDTARLGVLLDANPELIHHRYPDMPYGNIRLRGATLLHLAIEFQERECVALLLDRDAHINAQANRVTTEQGETVGGQSPLFHAIGSWMGHGRSLLGGLVERLGNEINWVVEGSFQQFDQIKGPMTARAWLLQNPDELSIVRAATKDASDTNEGITDENLQAFGKALLHDGGDIDLVRRMLEQDGRLANCNPWAPGWVGSAIEAVAGMCVWHRANALAIARLLVAYGATCSLQTAARAGLLDEVKRQMKDQFWMYQEVDAQGRTPLYRAACVYGKFHEGEAVADYLVEQGAPADLYSACTLGLLDNVRELLADDPSLATQVDPDGMTALHWAVRNRRHPEHAAAIVKLLIKNGANLEAENPKEDGMHPLHHCTEWPATQEVTDLLIEAGADVNARAGQSQWTVLDYALDRGREEIAEFIRDKGGRTRKEIGSV